MDTLTLGETDWWWIDYLENELDPKLEEDLETLLRTSADDRDSFENFRLLKQWVKDSDPLAKVDVETRLRRVHAGVMAEISKLPPLGNGSAGAGLRPRRERDLEAGI